jgi:hypothetical protein
MVNYFSQILLYNLILDYSVFILYYEVYVELLVRKDMDVHEHERLSNITSKHLCMYYFLIPMITLDSNTPPHYVSYTYYNVLTAISM